MSLLDCHVASPYRPVDWRWRRAGAIRLGLLPTAGRGADRWVRRAIRYRDACVDSDDSSCPGLERLDPAVFGAQQVRSSVGARERRELEARVLASQATGEIAARLGLTAEVVEAYERLFFDVRDRLGAAGYIMGVVIGQAPHDSFVAGDCDAILKFFAYGYGPSVLDAVIAVLGVGAEDGDSPVPEADRDLARLVRMAILARSIPIDERSAPLLIRLNSRLLELELEATAGTAISSPIRTMVEPFEAFPLGEQDRIVTSAPTDAAGVATGLAFSDDILADRIGILSSFTELAPILSGAPARWTA